ncbi:hypothetical protein [Geomesophilobacter sediminis]|uniref:Uncharacterized protein n=1 Tax=Geomesophilobacter sediminis TaxID=2798584 RepID=A0A8J7LUK4_9BACT|nr:hypothetical protein [Geomesophilobacter sediminis]MBJ6723835.1 hypothetical protein [Geomesophilobacter sediminis]
MSVLPEGEELHRAVKWISGNLQEDPNQEMGPLLREAIFKFNLSPKDSEHLIEFYREAKLRG